MTIDDRLRRFRSYLPDTGTGEAAARALAHRVMERAETAPAPGASRTRRRGMAVAAVTGLAAMGALAVVAVKFDRRSSAASTVMIGQPRVDWGMNALVTVTPDPGVSLKDATQRAKELLAERLERMDVQGAEVGSPKPGQVSLKVPGAETPQQFGPISRISRVQLFSTDQRIAHGRTLTDLRKQLPPLAADAPRQYLLEYGEPPYQMLSGVSVADSMSEIRRLVREAKPTSYSVLPIDRRWTYTTKLGKNPEHVIVRGEPVIPTSSLTLSIDGTAPVISYPARYESSPMALVAAASGGEAFPPWRAMPTLHMPRSIETSMDGSQRQLKLDDSALVISATTGAIAPMSEEFVTTSRSLTGTVTYTSFSRYGTPPAPTGTPVARPLQFAHQDARWSRTFVARRGWAQVTIYSWMSSKSKAGTSFIFGDTSGGGMAGPLSRMGQDAPWCPFGLGAPPVFPCLSQGLRLTNRSAKQSKPRRATLISAGRAAPGTSRIEAHLKSGRVIEGDVDQKWYAVFTDDAVTADDWKSPAQLKVYDDAGQLIQEITVRLG